MNDPSGNGGDWHTYYLLPENLRYVNERLLRQYIALASG